MSLQRRWSAPRSVAGVGAPLASPLGLHPVAADILYARGFTEPEGARRFLEPSLTDLARPDEQKGMAAAVELLVQAISDRRSILVYGDYDVDGQCGTALLVDFLRRSGARADYFVPDRMTHGYGLSEEGIREVAGREPDVLVTVDCGINSLAEVALAAELGMDVIVCDHHPPGDELPPARAVLNPHRADCGFAARIPCATGVAFSLICGLRAALPERLNLKAFMDLVALATVADVVPLVDHNRVLVAHGLEVVSKGIRPGLAALCEVSGLNGAVTATDVGFKLAPRLNAAGRLGDASRGVELLIAPDGRQARRLAQELDEENMARRRITADVTAAAIEQVEREGLTDAPAIVVGDEGWHPGVAGIVAARLVERFGRPAVVVGFEDGVGKGSARTVGDFDVGAAVRACSDFTETGGGHAGAAGLGVAADRWTEFRAAFIAQAEADMPTGGFFLTVDVDAEVALDQIDGRLVDDLARLRPFGAGNPEPVFASRGVTVDDVRVLKGEHVKCTLLDADRGVRRDAIGFGLADRAPSVGERIDAAYTAGWNEWRGRRDLQLVLKDLRTQEPQ